MDLNEEIAKVAYELYERDGKRDGKDQEHWLEAERIVRARRMKQSKSESGQDMTSKPNKPTPKVASKSVPKAASKPVRKEAPKPSAPAAAQKAKKIARTPRTK
jgi:hypothetical protein